MRSITGPTAVEKNRVANASAWLWLVELQVDASTAIRIVADYDAQVTWQGVVWYPLAAKVSDIRRDGDGRVSDATLSISHVKRYFVSYLDGSKLVGKRCRLVVIHASQIGDSAAGIEDLYTVNGLELSEDSAAIRIGVANPLSQPVPSERFARTYCRFLPEYGSAASRCGYDKNLAGALSSCDGTLEGANGCRVHGDNEVARGLPRLHPLRFGGFPGIGAGPIEV